MGSVMRLRLVTVGDKFADDLLTLGVQLSITHVATVALQAEYRGSFMALAVLVRAGFSRSCDWV